MTFSHVCGRAPLIRTGRPEATTRGMTRPLRRILAPDEVEKATEGRFRVLGGPPDGVAGQLGPRRPVVVSRAGFFDDAHTRRDLRPEIAWLMVRTFVIPPDGPKGSADDFGDFNCRNIARSLP